MAWNEVNAALGGTGYLTTSGINGCGREYCPNYGEVLDEINPNLEPDVVVIAGGQNDFSEWSDDADAVSEAIRVVYEDARSKYPDARVIAVGPSVLGSVNDLVTAFDAEVQDAAAAVDAEYVSMIDPEVLDPSMDIGDGGHVDDTGHHAIAEQFIQTVGSS